MTLQERRRQWEKGLTPLTVLTDAIHTLVILKDKQNHYHCHRYFLMVYGKLESWECSVDGQGVSIEAVLSWLNHPFARSTKDIITLQPA